MVIQNTLDDDKIIESKLIKVRQKDIINNQIEIPEGITTVGKNAFADLIKYCKTQAITIKMPSTLKIIEEQAFEQMNINELKFPENMETIKKEAFSWCTFQHELELPKSFEVISHYSFTGSTFLDKVIFPEKLKTIEPFAFSFTEFMQPIKLPETTKELQSYSFYKSEFYKIDLPKCEIGYNAFSEVDKEYINNESSYTIYGKYYQEESKKLTKNLK